jgi:hypothetical protein
MIHNQNGKVAISIKNQMRIMYKCLVMLIHRLSLQNNSRVVQNYLIKNILKKMKMLQARILEAMQIKEEMN